MAVIYVPLTLATNTIWSINITLSHILACKYLRYKLSLKLCLISANSMLVCNTNLVVYVNVCIYVYCAIHLLNYLCMFSM